MAEAERMGDYASRLEAERFVGRRDLLARIDGILDGSAEQRIAYLHGPGGVGKSALLRAAERRARADGRPVVRVDGRLIGPVRADLLAALAPAERDGAVLLLDEADQLGALRDEVRDAVLGIVPASGCVLLAGREAPGRAWFEGELQTLTVVVAVRPLDAEDARDLLARRGVLDPDEVDAVVRWSGGYPLALSLAASLPAEQRMAVPSTPATTGAGALAPVRTAGGHGALDDLLLERLGGRELDGVDPDVLDVASIAPAVDGPLLAAVLPGRPTRLGVTALRSLSISEPIGVRTTLHPLARTALRARLRDSDPDRHRTLVLRIAAHLHRRALAGDAVAALELGSLVEDPELRLGADRSATFYGDVPRAGDVEAMASATGAGDTAWFARFVRWCEERPGQAIAVRRADGSLSGMSVVCMASDAPAWADDDIETGPVLSWLRERGLTAEAALTHGTLVLEDDADPARRAEVIRVGNAATMAMGAVRNPRYVFATSTVAEYRGIAPLHYELIDELRRSDDERELVTLSSDFGDGGIVGQMHRMVLAEQGELDPATVRSATPRGELLLAALRRFHDDDAMAATPLAGDGASVAERAAVARAAVHAAVDAAFGPSPADRQLHLALVRAYLDPDGGHGVAQRELHMSRSSFYRFLQRARDRLLDAT